MIKTADGEKRVCYQDVIKEVGLEKKACQRVCEDALRAEGVSYKTPRCKIYISEDDAAERREKARVWHKRPESYWSEDVKAYFDNRAFPVPLTPEQRKRFRQGLVTGHLRKASEGTDRGFTKP